MTRARKRLRVVVVEDSAVTRRLLAALLDELPEFEVIETVADGRRSVERVVALAPDVVTMDIHLPGIDGIEATRRIMRQRPTPVLVVSASSNVNGETVFDALQAGAVSVVLRPMPPGHPEYHQRRRRFVRELRSVASVAFQNPVSVAASPPSVQPARIPSRVLRAAHLEMVGVAASTGGPSAIRRLLTDLRHTSIPPLLIVQHMAPGFLSGFAEWLTEASGRRTRVARAGQRPVANEVLLAPDDRHLTVRPDGVVDLGAGPLVRGHRPSADVLFASLATAYGSRAMGVILTGMGRDGADGLLQLRNSGGITLGQDRTTSVVYGMPAAAAEIGALQHTVPLPEMADLIASILVRRETRDPTPRGGSQR